MKNRTSYVKTAISVPGEVLDRATRRAKELHMSRSELFTRAADQFLNELEAESVTSRINAVVASTPNDASEVAVVLSRRVLVSDSTEW
ncbi:MAG TPA: hypothetical protein VII65_01125 [Acidimicrobiales bacterium]